MVRMIWAVALGAAAGGVARYYVSVAVQPRMGSFPWATLIINVTGSLLLGFLMRYALATPGMSVEVRALLTTGFCGGYTTFSTYSYETARLLEDGDWQRAGAYAFGSMGLALAATFVGFSLAGGLTALRDRA